jgi:NAD(P)-dependent dehydrogenase (short-subunit alcohol dehydrogenase family)
MTQKVALITGASRPLGLGFAVAGQLADLGYHVVLTARDATRAQPLAQKLRQDGYRYGDAPGSGRSGQHRRGR